jgi:four helix bundle protein
MRNFRELEIWKRSFKLVNQVYSITKTFPKAEMYGLTSQIKRCAISIPSNIAEGCSRLSNKEMHRYLEIAIGSSFELETQLLIAKEQKLTPENIDDILKELDQIQKMMNAFRKTLKP